MNFPGIMTFGTVGIGMVIPFMHIIIKDNTWSEIMTLRIIFTIGFIQKFYQRIGH